MLFRSLYRILHDTLQYLDKGKGETDEMTQKAYEFYRDVYEAKEVPLE